MADYKENVITDDANKLTGDDEKCKVYESSTDSGFISSQNLILTSEDIQSPLDSEIIEEENPKSTSEITTDYMRSDSGICLTSSFSNLNLSSGLNNLNSKKSSLSYSAPTKFAQKKEDNISTPREVIKEELPWELFYQQDEEGDTQLHTAILSGFLEVVIALIRGAPQPRYLDIINDDCQTPLHIATALGQWRIVRWLVVAGARPSIRNRCGDTALHVAARTGSLECCRAILDPVHQQERAALSLRYPPQAYHLIEMDQCNYNGQTCVHVAAIEGHVNILRHLDWYGADMNARDMTSGYTALHYALEYGDEKLMQFLLFECKNMNVHALSYQGYNALDVAASIPTNVAKALSSRGINASYVSSDEYDDSDSETEILYESSKILKSNLVINASA